MSLSIAWGHNDFVEIEGESYLLNFEFSRILRWYEVFRDEEENNHFKVKLTLALVAELTEEEITKLSWAKKEKLFLEILTRIFGEQNTIETEKDLLGNKIETVEPEVRHYDLIEDSQYIYASFRQDYGINLLEEHGKMHWDEFNALLIGLSDDTKLRKVIEIRMMKIPPKCSDEERQQIIAAKKSVALKSNREAIQFEAMDLLERRQWGEKNRKGG